MSRAAVVRERTAQGDWRPVGVLLGTPHGLQGRVLPGDGARTARMRRWLADAVRPLKGPYTTERGTWEDWIEMALWQLTDGHTRLVTEVPPEVSLRQLYEREILAQTPTLQAPEIQTPTAEAPTTLSGPKRARVRR